MKLGYVIALSAAMCAVPASAARVIYDETISFSSGQSDLRSFNLKSGRSYELRLTSETARLDLEIVGNYVEFR